MDHQTKKNPPVPSIYPDFNGPVKMVSDKRKLEIARVAHKVNAAYCRSIGDDTALGWEETSTEHKECLLSLVNKHLENPEITPEASHQSWLDQKTADGWLKGEEVDHELKMHPLMVPYADVPEEQRVKDHLFKAIVGSLSEMPEADLGDKVITKEVTRKPVKYIGKRDEYTDGLYKTGLTWKKGQTHMVANNQAVQLLTHKDQYMLGEVSEVVMAVGDVVVTETEAPKTDDDQNVEEERIQEAKDMINSLQDVETVKKYAFDNFSGKKLHHKIGLDKAKTQVLQMIDQFGLG